MLAMLRVGWWPGIAIDFLVMIGRLEGEAVGAFGALNLPSEKCSNTGRGGHWSGGGYLLPAPRPLILTPRDSAPRLTPA